MSFSSRVKDELVRVVSEAEEQRRAELSALLLMIGKYGEKDGEPVVSVCSEHAKTVRKYFTLLKKTYRINEDWKVGKTTSGIRNHGYTASFCGRAAVNTVLEACGITAGTPDSGLRLMEHALPKDAGCKRAFLRGAFLAAGSVSDPEKFYHLEFVCQNGDTAELIRALCTDFGETAGVVTRKRARVVYIKGSDEIVELLGVMEAPASLMEFENIRIVKDMRNSVNRKVNCETANISKTVGAAVRQLRDIEYIRDTEGLDSLPKNLMEIAEIRLRYPEMPLKELGQYLNPAVGKSGVNHRLRKLSEYAGQLRGENEQSC